MHLKLNLSMYIVLCIYFVCEPSAVSLLLLCQVSLSTGKKKSYLKKTRTFNQDMYRIMQNLSYNLSYNEPVACNLSCLCCFSAGGS